MKDHRKIAGRIVSGIKQGAFFTQLGWVQEQCLEKLGFKPFKDALGVGDGDWVTLAIDRPLLHNKKLKN